MCPDNTRRQALVNIDSRALHVHNKYLTHSCKHANIGSIIFLMKYMTYSPRVFSNQPLDGGQSETNKGRDKSSPCNKGTHTQPNRNKLNPWRQLLYKTFAQNDAQEEDTLSQHCIQSYRPN